MTESSNALLLYIFGPIAIFFLSIPIGWLYYKIKGRDKK